MTKSDDDKKLIKKVGQRRGRKGLTRPQKEAIFEAALALENDAEVARQFGLHPTTVGKIKAQYIAKLPPEERKARKDAVVEELADQYYQQTVQILDSIKPEDLKSGRLEQKDAQGNVVGYKDFGPSVVAKATAAGIFTDKIRILRDLERASANDQQTGQLLVPNDAQQLIEAIRGKVESLQILNVQFRKDNPNLDTKLDQVMEVAAIDATDDGFIDLRNPRE